MSLKDYDLASERLRAISQSPTSVIVVEGMDDERLLRSVGIATACSIVIVEGKQNVKTAMLGVESERCLFLYDRDFDTLFDDSRSICYPGADREAYLCDLVLGDVIESYASRARVEVDVRDRFLQSVYTCARAVGSLRDKNSKRGLGIDFDDINWLHDRIKKASVESRKKQVDFEEALVRVIENWLVTNLPKVSPLGVDSDNDTLYRGKDLIYILSRRLREIVSAVSGGGSEKKDVKAIAFFILRDIEKEFVENYSRSGESFIDELKLRVGALSVV